MSKKFLIKNIIFDLGKVLIDLDHNKTIEGFGGVKITAIYDKSVNSQFIKTAHKFERNEISSDEFRYDVKKIFNLNINDENFDKHWNSMVLEMPEHRISMLKQLKNNYRIFALSNTNQIHYDYFTVKDYWNPDLFENVYFSHQLGMRKPEAEIFEFVLNTNNLEPEETLFFDDNEENVKSAEKLGMISVLVKSEVCDIIKNYI